jgi:multidrug efflux pump subunit AcrA (membrane-fusion protein)
VKKDQVLAKMKTFDIETKRFAAMKEADKQEVEILRTRNEGKAAEMKAAQAAKAEAEAQVAMYDYMLSQAEIKAPFDGKVTRGDLFDRTGATVKMGEGLFEIVKTEDGRPDVVATEAEIQVSERDIKRVRDAWEKRNGKLDGKLATSSQPQSEFGFVITRIVPDAEAKEGENLFKVFAKIENPEPWMHPGLAGEARIEIEPSSIAWIYTHRLWDWLVLKRWAWTP